MMQLPADVELLGSRLGQGKSSRYVSQEKLGEGTFGEVRAAIDSISGKRIAIKYVRILSRKAGIPKAVFREMESLKQLSQCEYILKLFDVFTDESNLCLVTEYVESDLSEVIQHSKQHLPRSHLKSLFKMILEGLSYCHSRNIIHRDIKPANLLLTTQGVVKLADFGLARIYDAQDAASLSHQVATRQYRAPELLFAARHYTTTVDIWGAAVVMAELLSLQALFPGNNDIDQMYRVFQVMGSPTPEVWPGVESLPDYSKVSFPNMQPLPLSLVLPQAHPADLHFLSHLLVLDPARRMSAQDALRLPCFHQDAPLPSAASAIQVPQRVKQASANSVKSKPVDSVESFLAMVDDMIL